jgi:uncharacterized protein YndB with AHSA1/START domain
MVKKDWSSFTKRITVDATMRAIYNAWSTKGEIERWFLSRAEFAAPGESPRAKDERFQSGDTYRWEWHGYANGSPESGEVLEANGHDFLSFTFADECVVEVRILTEDGQKVVQLTQANIAPDENLHIYIGCGEGWTFYLANLKSILEGGIDLRNKNEKIARVINS